ncbi:MAG: ATP synthase subunit C [Methylobacter sp.]|jgi:V/A-type H+-transporting ATPase subunit K|nr:ATP synthase subunit C [Methylobacter sp.]
MYWWIGLITVSLVGPMALGILFELRPSPAGISRRRLKGLLGVNLLTFVVAEIGLLLGAVQTAMAAPPATVEGAHEVSVGLGLALIGAGIPTALATIGAGIAVGPVGAAALAVIADKPETFGRSLIYLGLAEGIAIYGLVVTILMLGRIG